MFGFVLISAAIIKSYFVADERCNAPATRSAY